MSKRQTTTDLVCYALNEMGIRTTNVAPTSKVPDKQQVEKARRRSLKEISGISANAKRLMSKYLAATA